MPMLAYPPIVHHHSSPLPQPDALTAVSTHLAESANNPSLHPDALLTPSGVQYSTHGGPTGGLTLHNLRRVEAGLRGEHLAADPEELVALGAGDDAVVDELIRGTERKRKREGDGEKEGGRNRGGKRKLNDVVDVEVEAGADADQPHAIADVAAGEGEGEGWQSLESYQQAQDGYILGEVGERNNAVVNGEGGAVPEVQSTAAPAAVSGAGGMQKVDKEARKRAKKERGKAEKREREAARKREKQTEPKSDA
ncbi:hypothetical protein LTR39_001885 [Cryomyces antarcticus]|nr:hypothetical protein LTR39_001885 [Cryomyces antarcticus]